MARADWQTSGRALEGSLTACPRSKAQTPLVVWNQGTLLGGGDWTGGGALPACGACPAREPRHPEAPCRHADIDGNLYFDQRRDPVRFFDLPLASWREHGYDRRSLVADPLFVDPGRYDFGLRPGSPALRIGFQPIDLSAVGPRRERLLALERDGGEPGGRAAPR